MASIIKKLGRTTASDAAAQAGECLGCARIFHYFVANVGGAVESDRARGHLGNGQDVGEYAFAYPSLGDDYLALYDTDNGISSAHGEQPDQEKGPE